jgi:hypothetical protein
LALHYSKALVGRKDSMTSLLRRIGFEGYAVCVKTKGVSGEKLVESLRPITSVATCFDITEINCMKKPDSAQVENGDVIRLPYKVTWMEYGFKTPDHDRTGVLCVEESKEIICLYLFVAFGHNRVMLICGTRLFLDSQGGWDGTAATFWPMITKDDSDASADAALNDVQRLVWPVLYSLKLLNCKNITSLPSREWHVEKRACRGLGVKQGHLVVFRTLHLKLPKKRTVPFSTLVSKEAQYALHSVAGHFKTYTADKPLFGRLTGRWWWHDFMKGDKKFGTIEKDYQIDVDDETP